MTRFSVLTTIDPGTPAERAGVIAEVPAEVPSGYYIAEQIARDLSRNDGGRYVVLGDGTACTAFTAGTRDPGPAVVPARQVDPAVAGFADKVMTMIDEDIADGTMPADVASFTDLHDHVDANTYLIDALAGAFPRGGNDAEVLFGDAEIAMGNAVSDEVNHRLAERAGAR
jgi:hypothetical protein